jgi:hypothetical protein
MDAGVRFKRIRNLTGFSGFRGTPRSIASILQLSVVRGMRSEVLSRARAAGLPESIRNHTFMGTGITVLLQNGGALEAPQDMVNHTDPRHDQALRRAQRPCHAQCRFH